MGNWKRIESVTFPSIWRDFERKNAQGIMQKYWVQDLIPEYEETFINTIAKGFLKDELISRCLKVCEHPQAVKDFQDFWREAIEKKLALICLTTDQNGKTNIVGGNMTCVSEKGERSQARKTLALLTSIASALDYVKNYKNVYDELNVNEFLTAYGLYVNPEYRGQGIGTEILKARREMALAVGLKVSVTLFTSIVSQKSAKAAGFQEFMEIDYDELEKKNPDWRFPGISSHTKSIKSMYIRYE